ncbi:MAG TPA: hypothetical protein VJ742_13050 [Nitrososphaera sp.]|nr:hypothetical protein [Nitrososphaera sp.]
MELESEVASLKEEHESRGRKTPGQGLPPTLQLFRKGKKVCIIQCRDYQTEDQGEDKRAAIEEMLLAIPTLGVHEALFAADAFYTSNASFYLSAGADPHRQECLSIMHLHWNDITPQIWPYSRGADGFFEDWLEPPAQSDKQVANYVVAAIQQLFNSTSRPKYFAMLLGTLAKKGHQVLLFGKSADKVRTLVPEQYHLPENEGIIISDDYLPNLFHSLVYEREELGLDQYEDEDEVCPGGIPKEEETVEVQTASSDEDRVY